MKRICNIHGLHSEKRCPKCLADSNAAYDAKRDPDHVRFYNSAAWKKVREMVLKEEPVCKMCGTRPSVAVDHIVPISAGGCRLCRDNLQGLCHSCHSAKTAGERRGG